MAEALMKLSVNLNNIHPLLQKCGSQLSPDWVSVGTIRSEERQGKRCTCIYWVDITRAINDGRSLWRKLGYLSKKIGYLELVVLLPSKRNILLDVTF